MKTTAEPLEKSVLFLASIIAGLALFFFFTSGIPLIQLGFLPNLGESKKQYLKIVQFSVLALIVFLVFLRWKAPQIFNKLWLVGAAKRIISLPVGMSVTGLFLIYGVTLSTVGIIRHLALETRAFDLGIFAQAVWTTRQGDFLYSSLKEGICLLGDHVSPLLAMLAIPYAVWPDPRTLLIIQAFAAAACFFPLTKIVEEKFSDQKTALVFALMYFFYMPTRAALHEDFHPEVLVEPFMFWAFLWLERGRLKLFLFALAVILSAKENMAGIVFAFGVYAGIFKQRRVLGLFLACISVGYLLFCTRWLVPYLSGKPYLYAGFYSQLIHGNLSGFFQMLADGERWEYLLKVYLPFLYLPFLDPPTLLLTLPVLMQNLLSNNGVARSFNYHYLTGLTPFLFIAAACGLFNLKKRFAFVRQSFDLFLMVLLGAALLRAGAPEYFYGWQSAERITARTELIRKKMREIPSAAVLLTQNNLVPQTANRRQVYLFDYNSSPTKTESAVFRHADYVVADEHHWEPGTVPVETEKQNLLAAGYGIEFEDDGFLVLKKINR